MSLQSGMYVLETLLLPRCNYGDANMETLSIIHETFSHELFVFLYK